MDCGYFYNILLDFGIEFFTGVPDSLLKDFCAYITDHTNLNNHITAANEGGAVALACGHYLATRKVGLVYMQNSGQGNAVNPLVSLADSEVYSIPMLLLIGWRGEPGLHDEPQHVKQGKITLSLLDTLGVPYSVLPEDSKKIYPCVSKILDIARKQKQPVALIVRKGTFAKYKMQSKIESSQALAREHAIKLVAGSLDELDVVVSTTGKISRELYEYRDNTDHDHSRDFLTVGSMGHCSQIAMGIAIAKPERQIYCFDGDGAVLMHSGSLAIIGSAKLKNFKHIVFNNGCHDSVGGQSTCGFDVSITDIAKACGYSLVLQASTAKEIGEKIAVIKSTQGPAMLEIIVNRGCRADLGRPRSEPTKNKAMFMEFLKK